MKNKKKIIIISSIAMFILLLGVLLISNTSSNNEDILEEVNISKNKTFAIMLQNDNGGYVESDSNTFPTSGYELNTTLTNCIDETGIKVEDVISYEDGNIAVETNKKVYCYVYFDSLSELCTSGSKLGSCLIEKNNKISSLDNTAYSGMYRYTGTNDVVTNNYVCFGTTSKEECLNNPNKYMYRMIGVTSEASDTLGLAMGQVKLIKNTSIGTYDWHTSSDSNTKWESSAMYTYLQGTSVLGSTSVIPSGWSNKISSVKWNIGDVQTWTNGDTVYGLEDNTQTSSTSKIGLMYLSDYYYAYNAGGTTDCRSAACTNWLTDTSNITWTMSRYGYSSSAGSYVACRVSTYGYAGLNSLDIENAIRPVFYLSASVNWKSGTGASGDPFIIE